MKREVDRFGSKEPWHLRIRNGPEICLEAAKDMTNLQVAVTESSAHSFLAVATSPLPAAYVLLIYIRCQPASTFCVATSVYPACRACSLSAAAPSIFGRRQCRRQETAAPRSITEDGAGRIAPKHELSGLLDMARVVSGRRLSWSMLMRWAAGGGKADTSDGLQG